MSSYTWLSVLAVLLGLAQASYYDDYLIEDLYKRLAQLDGYDDLGGLQQQQDPNYWMDDGILVDSRDPGQADLRDQEYLSHGPMKGGFQYISGGAGEGAQHLTPEGTQNNTQEVKSDETLPFYCHPPNPCPKGYTKDDGCDVDIDDTAERQKHWISDMMRSGKCSCDDEHMFECPKQSDTINTEKGHSARDNLDKVIDSLLQSQGENPYSKGNKRQYIVAKKSPVMFKRGDSSFVAKRDSSAGRDAGADGNPYLGGVRLPTVAKKSPGMPIMK